jgi:hypothetical protein
MLPGGLKCLSWGRTAQLLVLDVLESSNCLRELFDHLALKRLGVGCQMAACSCRRKHSSLLTLGTVTGQSQSETLEGRELSTAVMAPSPVTLATPDRVLPVLRKKVPVLAA